MENELPYFGTKDNPTNIANDDVEIDPTAVNILLDIKKDMKLILDNASIDPKQPATEYKIEGLANDKVKIILAPIIDTIDEKLKIMGVNV